MMNATELEMIRQQSDAPTIIFLVITMCVYAIARILHEFD